MDDDDDDYYYSTDVDDDSDYPSDSEIELHDSNFSKLHHSFQVITEESLLASQREDLSRVMELLSVREHHARTLLIHHRWDVEKLFSIYFDKGKARMFSEAGVTIVKKDVRPETTTLTCEICIDDVPFEDATSMDCGHFFCNICWTNHFIVKIDEGQSKRIRCMAHNCNTICDDSVVRNLVDVKSPELAKKFERFLLESYIDDNKVVKWCPSVPHCGNALQVENGGGPCEVECSCGTQFCFACTSEAHSPCSCLMWEMWAKKCSEESENVKWIEDNTKPCPKCKKSVEKNGGCNLVRCVCGQTFCYICGEATGLQHTWESIAGHSCGRYKDESEKKAKHSKQNVYRYVHYYNRYKAHADSSKKEKKLAETNWSEWSTNDSNIKNLTWLEAAFKTLLASRRALTYSYPFAFYMFGENMFGNVMSENEIQIKQNLFEDQQQRLEGNIESLSMFLGDPMHEYTKEKVQEITPKVINLSAATDTRCREMYKCIETEFSFSQAIAPFQLRGIQKAAVLSNGSNSGG